MLHKVDELSNNRLKDSGQRADVRAPAPAITDLCLNGSVVFDQGDRHVGRFANYLAVLRAGPSRGRAS